jgi:hypothetical protein
MSVIRTLAQVIYAAGSLVVAAVLLPVAVVVATCAGLGWLFSKIQLWAVYGGDEGARDKDRWRNS